MPQAIDYAALAAQARKTAAPPVDYSALAEQARKEPDFRAPNATDEEGNPIVAGNAAERFISNYAANVLPSTTPRDYIEGPKYAAQHPMDAIGLILRALWDSHAVQAGKTGEAAGRVMTEPTLTGKLGAASETLGHGLATVLPLVGPAAANAGELGAKGDVAGMLGAASGILTPSALGASSRLTAPLREMVADKLHGQAVSGMERAINPTRVDTKVKTARIVPQMLDRRVKAGSLQKLEDIATEKAATSGAAVDAALQPHSQDITSVVPLVDELEKAKAPYIGTSTTGTAVVNDRARVKAIQKLQDTLMDYGNDISVGSMVKLRRNWDQIVEAGKGFTTPKAGIKAWAAREGRSALAEELKAAVPNLDKVNAEYSFWRTLEDVTHASNQRKVGQKGNLLTTIAGGAGAVAAEVALPGSGLVKGGLQAALGAKVFSSLKRFVDSPGYQMWSAVQKERLADALMGANRTRVQGLIHHGMVTATTSSRATGRLQSGRPVPDAAEKRDHESDFEIVGGFNTRTREPEPGYEPITDVQKLIELGWDPSTAKQLATKARKAKSPEDSRRASGRAHR